MSETPPAPALGAQQAVELDEIRERTFQRAKMYLLANGLSDPSQLPAEYTDPARLLQVIAAQAARLAMADAALEDILARVQGQAARLAAVEWRLNQCQVGLTKIGAMFGPDHDIHHAREVARTTLAAAGAVGKGQADD